MDFKSGVKQNVLRIILWIAAIAWLAFCFFLSWQNGGDTAGLSWTIAEFFIKILKNVGLAFEVEQFHKYLRLFAHFGIFFVAGALFAAAVEVSLPQSTNRDQKAFCVAAGICSFAAVLAEVGKLAVPGRHLTWSEAGLNVLGAICGAGVVYMICKIAIGRAGAAEAGDSGRRNTRMPSEPQLKELHEEMLILLKWFHEFCMEHDIKYSLHGGTLLGAIRERGFIPWDDDIDVVLLRTEYDKIQKLFAKVLPTEDIQLQFFDKMKMLTMKRRDRALVWLDIIVYDYISENALFRKFKICGAMFLAGMMKSKETLCITKQKGKGWRYAAFYMAYLLGRPFPNEWKYRVFNQFCKHCLCGKRRYIHRSNDQYRGVISILPAEAMEDYTLTAFNDTELMITTRYEMFLRMEYGENYMSPEKSSDSESEVHNSIRDILEKRAKKGSRTGR